MTEIRKQANRLNFGEIEADAYQDDLGFSVGTLKKGGKGSSGIRAAQVNKATNARMSQTLQKRLAKQGQQVDRGRIGREAFVRPSVRPSDLWAGTERGITRNVVGFDEIFRAKVATTTRTIKTTMTKKRQHGQLRRQQRRK